MFALRTHVALVRSPLCNGFSSRKHLLGQEMCLSVLKQKSEQEATHLSVRCMRFEEESTHSRIAVAVLQIQHLLTCMDCFIFRLLRFGHLALTTTKERKTQRITKGFASFIRETREYGSGIAQRFETLPEHRRKHLTSLKNFGASAANSFVLFFHCQLFAFGAMPHAFHNSHPSWPCQHFRASV